MPLAGTRVGIFAYERRSACRQSHRPAGDLQARHGRDEDIRRTMLGTSISVAAAGAAASRDHDRTCLFSRSRFHSSRSSHAAVAPWRSEARSSFAGSSVSRAALPPPRPRPTQACPMPPSPWSRARTQDALPSSQRVEFHAPISVWSVGTPVGRKGWGERPPAFSGTGVVGAVGTDRLESGPPRSATRIVLQQANRPRAPLAG